MGQGGYWGDRPLGCSVLLLHPLLVPKIENSDVSLPASIPFLSAGSVGYTFQIPIL